MLSIVLTFVVNEKRGRILKWHSQLAWSEERAANAQIDFGRAFSPNNLLGAVAHVYVEQSNGNHYLFWKGYVTAFTALGEPSGIGLYHLTLGSLLAPLTYTQQQRVFLGQTLPERLQTILKPYNISLTWQGPENLPEISPPDNLVVQYAETDLLFLWRQIRQYGLLARLEDNALVVYDKISRVRSKSYHLPLASGMQTDSPARAWGMNSHATWLTQSIHIIAYHDLSPDTSLRAVAYAVLPSESECHILMPKIDNLDHALRCAIQQRDAIKSQSYEKHVSTDEYKLQLGDIVYVGNDVTAYSIVEINHHYEARPNSLETSYRNDVKLVSFDKIYRATPLPLPPYQGLLTAVIEGEIGGISLDSEGRYRFRYSFDASHTSMAQASSPTRLLSPLTGAEYGWHFPLPVGTEVLIDCLQGDISRPIIIGVLPGPTQPLPVTNISATQHMISSRVGHILQLDDAPFSPAITMATPHAEQLLHLNAESDAQHIQLLSQTGSICVTAKDTLTRRANENSVQYVGGEHETTVNNCYQLCTQQGDIMHTAGGNINHTAQQQFTLRTQHENLTQQAGESVLQGAQQRFVIASQTDAISFTTAQGEIVIQGAQSITCTAEAEISIQQGQGRVCFAEGDILIEAPTVACEAPDIILTAPCVNLGAEYQPARADVDAYYWNSLQRYHQDVDATHETFFQHEKSEC